ncbi:hypothetical protein BKA58DRAFT_110715 [Alternaria rosae]|uniref:uncharacterized protein n=1 Tax=Alternaria rosae TaxID=1187941 RepID=UPI001E8DF10E|nr:uncharacterized protein BKA58DRAFT_110715 [Alternaria rosae]KAH6879158.1 hypothetical protein BKA58DRAFT_110715 [Alternaria rosae]
MSDNDNTAVANGSSPQFTERELQLLGWAMQSLKSGPPEIDYEKLAAYAGMGNPRSASNAWAKIKLKLMTPSPDGTVPATPKKTPRKRAAKKQDVDGESSPKKKTTTPRGRKTETVKTESDEEAQTGGSPMKIDPAKEEIVEDEV